MRFLLLWLAFVCVMSSCTVQKRLYRPGLTFFKPGKLVKGGEKISAIESRVQFVSCKIEDRRETLKQVKSIDVIRDGQSPTPANHSTIVASTKVKLAPTRLLLTLRPVSSLVSVGPNSVPKAGFRTFIYSLVLFGGALYCFFNLTGFVYVTAGLLIMAFVFCLVSLLTSVSARKDKINNSKGWLVMSLITLLLDILEIAAIAIFFIALF
jgi:hypothetical protein